MSSAIRSMQRAKGSHKSQVGKFDKRRRKALGALRRTDRKSYVMAATKLHR